MALVAMTGQTAAQAPVPPAPLPSAGDVLRQIVPPAVPVAPAAPPLPAIKGATLPPPMNRLPNGGPAVAVAQVRVEGNRVIATAELEREVAQAAGQTLTLAQMDELATRLTLYYRSRGYFVARAYVPAQDLTSGTLVLRVVEGNYGRFLLDNKSLVRDSVVQGLLDDIKDRDIVSLDTLERAMLIINDTPGVKVTGADVLPGQAVGTSDFAVATEATPTYDGYLLVDNYGSRYTGRDRITFNGDWNSPTGRGDRLSLGGLVSTGGDLVNLRLAYGGLVASNGSRLEGAVSRTRYSLGDSYASLDATGIADSLEANFTTPFKRTREASIELGAGLAHRQLKDELGSVGTSVRKRSDAVALRASGNWNHSLFGFDGLTQASASVTVGRLSFQDDVAASQDAAGARTAGGWSKVNLALSRITALPAQLQLSTSVRLQHVLNDKNLDGSERMSISGPGAVMAYPTGELAGDNAFVARGELARPLGVFGQAQLSGSVYGAWGLAGAARPLLPQNGTRHLGDVGVELNASAGRWLLKVTFAHRVQGGPALSEPASATRLLVQGGFTF